MASFQDYTFEGGYPGETTIQRAYDDADLIRAIQLYKRFFSAVSGNAILEGNAPVGVLPNRTFGTMDTHPAQMGLTLNSDTPYAPLLLDLSEGPLVIDMPPGPFVAVMMDMYQRWVCDMGLPGPEAGKGAKHLILPPGFEGDVPEGFHVWHSQTLRLLGGARAIPVDGDVAAAKESLTRIRVYPLDATADWSEPQWLELSIDPQDTTPNAVETTIDYWKSLHRLIDAEPPVPGYEMDYGDLASLGIAKGSPFAPDARLTEILERASSIASDQMRVQSFADRRPDRVVWPDSQWEWAALRFENGDFTTGGLTDEYAREKWFYQAIGTSPAMFRRSEGAGSLYWLGLRDSHGHYLDGGNAYTLKVPLPVPGKLFWSVTVYDAITRSQIQTDRNHAALRSLIEFPNLGDAASITLSFGPEPPASGEDRWIETIPGRGWFVYFRIYGPEAAAFDGSWKPGEFELLDKS